MTVAQAIAYLDSLSLRGWRLGLDRMEELVRRAGLEAALTELKHIHIAGTNGKGSLAAYVQSILTYAGYPAGGFFSPFVYDIRERIQLNAEPISAEDFTLWVETLRPIADSLEGTEFGAVTEFEFKTAMGLAHWQAKGAEWVALEVGLGGRLDATNVVTPAAAVIVSIGLDHTGILGETLGEIAREKAGILKAGIPAVIGDLPPEAREAVRQVATARGITLWEFGREFGLAVTGEAFTPVRTLAVEAPLPGRHQRHNVAVAIAALDAAGAQLTDEQIRQGLSKTRIPGRFERRSIQGRLVILDGAHNAESMEALAETLAGEYPEERFAAVFGMLEGHDPGPVARAVERFAAEIHLSPIDFRRSRRPEDLAPYFDVPAFVHKGPETALLAALDGGRAVVVTGSFYLVGEVGQTISFSSL